MKTLRSLKYPPPTWVNPQHPVRVAAALMQSLNTDVLPVVDNRAVVGAVTARQIIGVSEFTLVSEVMQTDVLLLDADLPVRQAASQMVEQMADYAIVVNDELVGVIRPIDLIPDVSRSFDPLTKLPWQDVLREWSVAQLQTGHEITILFFDIDHFGQFNKKYDHVTGDQVLEKVARVMEEELDPDSTVLCRYGGDEFAVATLYMLEDAQQLAARIAHRVEEINITGVAETISVSYGVFGGRRTREREAMHYAATVNNLIVRASRLCLQMKQQKGLPTSLQLALPGVEEIGQQEGERVLVASVSYVAHGKEAHAGVELAMGSTRVLRQVSGDIKTPAEELMVQAARDALVALVPQVGALHIQHVERVAVDLHEKGEKVDGIMVVVEVERPSGNMLLSGFALVRENVYRAAVNALLHALNRPLSRWLSQARLNSAM